MSMVELRREYHHRICEQIVRTTYSKKYKGDCPNFSDSTNKSSIDIGWGIVNRMQHSPARETIPPQTLGRLFEELTKTFLEDAFGLLHHLRPGKWEHSTNVPISRFEQYEHLADLEAIIEGDNRLASALGTDYIITPDIVVARWPVSDTEVNQEGPVVDAMTPVARHTRFRAANLESPCPFLHASISCKWTIRSDRAQNPRTEALNLIRNRKGRVPHIAVVTAEPLPTRIASIALGTGDLDCVYHFALPELEEAVQEANNEDQLDMLNTLVNGRRLRDVSDLPFDLAV